MGKRTEYQSRYYHAHKEQRDAYHAEWVDKNRDRINAYNREWRRARKQKQKGTEA